MAIQVRIFGDLKEKIGKKKYKRGAVAVLTLDSSKFKSVFDVLNELSIDKDEVSHIFVNHSYSSVNKKVEDGDRIGIFPRKNMALLYKWYFNKEE